MKSFSWLSVLLLVLPIGLSASDRTDDDAEQGREREERQERLMELHCRDELDRPESWLDRSHAYMSQRLCEPAAWFD
ncbi:MAG: hypothetical protein EA419_06395, partial [Wenzhouxiangella sp.]